MIDIIFTITALIPVILSTLGTSIGQSLIGKQALASILKQPSAANNISKLSVIGIAVTETAAVIGAVVSWLLLKEVDTVSDFTWINYGIIGIAFAVGLSGLCAGIASSFPAVASCQTLARQPFLQTKTLNIMLITQTLIMTPNMFGMIVALLIKAKMLHIQDFTQALQLLSSGIAIGFGSIGPSIGLAFFAFAACKAIGVNPQVYGKIMTFTFICEAIIETPVIFSLLISLVILNTPIIEPSIIQGWQFLAAAICIGLSTISPGINLGRTGASACNQIALHPTEYVNISRIGMLALAMIDTFTIYGFLISIFMLLL